MARSDLLISLVKAGKLSPDPRFRSTVEAIIAEERAKHHTVLADQLAAAMLNGQASAPLSAGVAVASTIGDLLHEVASDRGLADLVLAPGVRDELQRLIEEHSRRALLESYGLAPRHRVLLVGPPGNGKTSVAHALARDLMVPLFAVRYEGLIGSYLGETASRLRKLFDFARQRSCVLFLDEFDTIGKERGDEHETGEIKRVVSTLLLQMDRLPSHVVIVTATNHPELLDRAVWRRFELRLELGRPSTAEANEFLSRLFSRFSLSAKQRPTGLAEALAGATYSELEDFFREVARDSVLQAPDSDVRMIVRRRLASWKKRYTFDKPRRRK